MRIRNALSNYIEDELMHYHDTRKEIENIRTDIIKRYRSAGSDNTGSSGSISRPTENKVIELFSDVKLERMLRITTAIENVINRLQPEKRQLIQIIYWDRPRILTWHGAAIKLHITKRTLFRWKREIIKAIAERGGFL